MLTIQPVILVWLLMKWAALWNLFCSLVGKSEGKGPLERPMYRQTDTILKMDLTEYSVSLWAVFWLAENRLQGRPFVNMKAVNFWFVEQLTAFQDKPSHVYFRLILEVRIRVQRSFFFIKYEFVYVVGSSVLCRIYARVSTCTWCCSELCVQGNELTVLVFRRVCKIAKSNC
jgi:hypothetical protein